MKIGINTDTNLVFLEVNNGGKHGGLNTTMDMTARTARAIAGQLVANAEILEATMEEDNQGNSSGGTSA